MVRIADGVDGRGHELESRFWDDLGDQVWRLGWVVVCRLGWPIDGRGLG